MTPEAPIQTLQPATARAGAHKEPIAIIGIGCRYPGGVRDVETFWQLLVNGIDAITDIPADRVDVAPYYDPVLAAPGKIASSQGGFLDKVDRFDASFFGVSPREANYMDPQQRLLLETAWEALEDAGQVPENLKESQTGVFIGMWANDYTEKMYKATEDINLYVTTGGGRYAASGRVSYFFGFQGPSLTVDTACSSSLVTVHLACQSLREGESNLALAGGVNLILEPSISIGYSRSKMLSPDGRCKFGDARANGYVRSEGAGMVVLKRLSDALADHDPIYAVIRGSAVNNDGRSSELLVAPGVDSQVKMLREAYQNAGVDACQVGYVEAHGTGTPIGDPVELEALGTVLSENRDPAHACRVGSVKTNIGHTEAASGVAGLIKTALILKHKAIPPSLHFQQPNPKIPFDALQLRMQTELTVWPDPAEPAIAAVNSFGITGTNAHLVLEEAPRIAQVASKAENHDTYLLPLSAQTPEALQALIQSYLDFLSKQSLPALNDLCYTASCRRAQHAERLAITGTSHAEFAEQLSAHLVQEVPAGKKFEGQPRIAFVFPGQGAQWLGMGRELFQKNPIFRDSLTQCGKALRTWTDWSLLEQLALEAESADYRLDEISVIQPTLFAMEVALAEVWRSWGVEPAAVIGHSMGEVAAAYIAGALTLDDAARVICRRSQLMQQTSGQGAMAVIGLPYGETEKLLSGLEDKLSIAVQNSPKSTVLSGDPAALEAVMENLRAREIFCRLIKVDVASHSPQMDPIRPSLVESLKEIQPQSATVPFYSTVAEDICAGETLDSEYWGRNLRQPVRFSGTLEKLLEQGHSVFIEMSPHPILLSSIEETSREADQPAYGFASLRRDQPELRTLLGELGSLYPLGYDPDWNQLYPNGGNVVPLPAYPWQREHYWFESDRSFRQTRPGAHPLLAQYMQSASGEHIWETEVSTKLFPYLSDHKVRGSAVFPAAGYIEMILAAAKEIYGSKSYSVRKILFQEAFYVPAEEPRLIQLVLTADSMESAEFHIYTRAAQNDDRVSWALHASGNLEMEQNPASEKAVSLGEFRSDVSDISAEEFYQAVSGRGLEYGPAFQAVEGLAHQQDGILARIKLPESLISQAAKYRLHPVVVDACLQAFLAALVEENTNTYLPTSLEFLQTYAPPDLSRELWCYVTPISDQPEIGGDLHLFNQDGQRVLSARGLSMQVVKAGQPTNADLFYEIQWQESPIPYHEPGSAKHWLILADQQGTGASLAEALQKDSQAITLVFAGESYRCTDTNRYELSASNPAHFQQLLQDISRPVHGIVHLWSLDQDAAPTLADPNLQSILYLTQAIAQRESGASPELWLITRGAQSPSAPSETVSPAQAPVWGIGAVISNEFPNLHCARLDLSLIPMEQEVELLARALQAGDGEDQLALRNRQRYAARLKRVALPAADEEKNAVLQKIAGDQSFQVQVPTPGILDHLSLVPMLRRAPQAGQVEIAVKATGLNFMNIMAALGILPGYAGGVGPLGIECAGIVTRIGEGVTDLRVGDPVAAIAFDCLASHAVADARLVVKKPAFLSFEEAAAIPIAYVTAYYAFHDLGRLQAGERVLIHAATGGVGLAAIQLAKRAGAEIFATAGSEEKRDLLRQMGIAHLADSRSLGFADEFKKQTGGEGVDLVLNSLAGNAIAKGLELLKPYGRFLEIGKRDIYQNSKVGLLPFQRNLSYFAIDLDKMSRERPDLVGKMLRQVFRLLEAGEIDPLPVQSFPVSEANEAFRRMAQAKHIGKIIITLEDPQASLALPAGSFPIQADATYLITGGLGDLGLAFARWLAERGARHLVLVGRRKPSEAAQKKIEELQAAGVEIVAAAADVTDLGQLSKVFNHIHETLPPLKGVIHAAGLLADATIPQMGWERFQQAYAPKVLGAWNLHTLTADQPLDFFILFSSVAAFLGMPGQVNYAAGNAFLDGLARFRHANNLPAVSINWGPWSEIGLASAEASRGGRLAQQGLMSISPAQGLEAMSSILAGPNAQISVMQLDAQKWCASQSGAARSSLFKEILNQSLATAPEKKSSGKNIRAELLATEAGRPRRQAFDALLREHVAQVLHLPASRVPSDKPLKTLGLDSLMSIELRNRLEDALGVSLSASLIYNYPTVKTLVPFLAEKMGIPLETEGQARDVQEAKPESHSLDDLNKDELEALLAEELSAIDDALKGNGFDTEAGTR